ncbi:MAG: Nif3-like dinuclear metal center hexameric protein [Anaerolineae bacterium]|nr:Nif3-like dinuclear metal center hexameric protein [Anaerolineae bacterium]
MNQTDLVLKLNEFFNIQAFNERDLWTSILPAPAISAYERFGETEFVQGGWNGLMLKSSEEIDRVYMIVFPDQPVLDTILALELEREAPGSMIFAHHPADFEEAGRGFVGIKETQLEELREHNINYYCCHAPLDCHPEVSTVIALAKALKLMDWELFSPHHGGMEGVHGRITGMGFGGFAQHLATVTDLPYIQYNQVRHNGQPVEHIAVIPGGGDDPKHLQEALDLGCDTYVTGHWWLIGNYDYAAKQREFMRELVPQLPMNLIGTSHYTSEMVVLRDQMPTWFRNAGIEARFIKQPDPWR